MTLHQQEKVALDALVLLLGVDSHDALDAFVLQCYCCCRDVDCFDVSPPCVSILYRAIPHVKTITPTSNFRYNS